jgi:plastocyanin
MTLMNTNRWWLVALGLALTAGVFGCSSNDNSNPVKSPGTGSRLEFASGDLQNGQSYTHVFATAKVVPYYCRQHGGTGGAGMSGVITVAAGGTPSKHSFSITGMTLPSATIDVMDTVTWTNNDGPVHSVQSDN